MSTTVFQTLYVGPAQYEGAACERAALLEAAGTFLLEYGGPQSDCSDQSEIIGVQTSVDLGVFLVFTKSKSAAVDLPWHHQGYERCYEIVAVPASTLSAWRPLDTDRSERGDSAVFGWTAESLDTTIGTISHIRNNMEGALRGNRRHPRARLDGHGRSQPGFGRRII